MVRPLLHSDNPPDGGSNDQAARRPDYSPDELRVLAEAAGAPSQVLSALDATGPDERFSYLADLWTVSGAAGSHTTGHSGRDEDPRAVA